MTVTVTGEVLQARLWSRHSLPSESAGFKLELRHSKRNVFFCCASFSNTEEPLLCFCDNTGTVYEAELNKNRYKCVCRLPPSVIYPPTAVIYLENSAICLAAGKYLFIVGSTVPRCIVSFCRLTSHKLDIFALVTAPLILGNFAVAVSRDAFSVWRTMPLQLRGTIYATTGTSNSMTSVVEPNTCSNVGGNFIAAALAVLSTSAYEGRGLRTLLYIVTAGVEGGSVEGVPTLSLWDLDVTPPLGLKQLRLVPYEPSCVACSSSGSVAVGIKGASKLLLFDNFLTSSRCLIFPSPTDVPQDITFTNGPLLACLTLSSFLYILDTSSGSLLGSLRPPQSACLYIPASLQVRKGENTPFAAIFTKKTICVCVMPIGVLGGKQAGDDFKQQKVSASFFQTLAVEELLICPSDAPATPAVFTECAAIVFDGDEGVISRALRVHEAATRTTKLPGSINKLALGLPPLTVNSSQKKTPNQNKKVNVSHVSLKGSHSYDSIIKVKDNTSSLHKEGSKIVKPLGRDISTTRMFFSPVNREMPTPPPLPAPINSPVLPVPTPTELVQSWRRALQLPDRNILNSSFKFLLNQGIHPAAEALTEPFKLASPAMRQQLKEILSMLCWFSPFFSKVSYLPRLVFPFVKALGDDTQSIVEIIFAIFLNWGQEFFAFYPRPPVNLVCFLYYTLQDLCPALIQHFASHGVSAASYIWDIITSFYSEILPREGWMFIMQKAFHRQPVWLFLFHCSWLAAIRGAIFALHDKDEIIALLHRPFDVDLDRLINAADMLFDSYERSSISAPYEVLHCFREDRYPSVPVCSEILVAAVLQQQLGSSSSELNKPTIQMDSRACALSSAFPLKNKAFSLLEFQELSPKRRKLGIKHAMLQDAYVLRKTLTAKGKETARRIRAKRESSAARIQEKSKSKEGKDREAVALKQLDTARRLRDLKSEIINAENLLSSAQGMQKIRLMLQQQREMRSESQLRALEDEARTSLITALLSTEGRLSPLTEGEGAAVQKAREIPPDKKSAITIHETEVQPELNALLASGIVPLKTDLPAVSGQLSMFLSASDGTQGSLQSPALNSGKDKALLRATGDRKADQFADLDKAGLMLEKREGSDSLHDNVLPFSSFSEKVQRRESFHFSQENHFLPLKNERVAKTKDQTCSELVSFSEKEICLADILSGSDSSECTISDILLQPLPSTFYEVF